MKKPGSSQRPKMTPGLGANHDDPEAASRFDELVRKVLSVPRDEILRREEEYKRQAALNPNKRGPKPRNKKSN